jgi:hypothetical protein
VAFPLIGLDVELVTMEGAVEASKLFDELMGDRGRAAAPVHRAEREVRDESGRVERRFAILRSVHGLARSRLTAVGFGTNDGKVLVEVHLDPTAVGQTDLHLSGPPSPSTSVPVTVPDPTRWSAAAVARS